MAALACSTEPLFLVDPDRTVRFEALEMVAPVVDGSRVKWELEGGLTITMQRVPVSDRAARERSLADVASALSQRFALGELEGGLDPRPCVVGGTEARCLSGWTTRESVRFVRDGVLVRAGGEILLVEAIGPESMRQSVERQGEMLRRTLVLTNGGGA